MRKFFFKISLVILIIFQGNLVSGENNTPQETSPKLTKSANIWVGTFNVPIGSIIAWVPNYENSQIELDKEKKLPKNFLICDGPHKTDNPDTKFDERKIPKINAENIFRGVNSGQILFIIKVD